MFLKAAVRLLLLAVPVLATSAGEKCFLDVSRRNMSHFSDIIYFPGFKNAFRVKTGHLKLLDSPNGDTIVLRARPALEYLVVSRSGKVAFCRPSVDDDVFKERTASCVLENIKKSNFRTYSGSSRNCSGVIIALEESKNVHPVRISSSGKLHKILREAGDLSAVIWEDSLLVGSFFFTLGVGVAFASVTLAYTRLKVKLTGRICSLEEPREKRPNRSYARSSTVSRESTEERRTPQASPGSTDMTTFDGGDLSKMTSREKVGLMLNMPDQTLEVPPAPKAPVFPKILDEKDEYLWENPVQ